VYSLNGVTTTMLVVSWVFVFSRIVHSLIHITYNNVIHRLSVYLAGSIAIWTMWALIATRLLSFA
jgi:hypothetical protein